LAKLLEGKPVARNLQEKIRLEVLSFKKKLILANIQVGDNPDASAYGESQRRAAEKLGIGYRLERLGQDTSEESLIELIQKLSLDGSVTGIIIQLPLPSQLDYKRISQFISPEKDVEGVHPVNIGRLLLGESVPLANEGKGGRAVGGLSLMPCTPAAVMELLKETGIDLHGKEAVVVGRSQIVGKPLAMMLLAKSATVTICHGGTSKAKKLEEHIKRAEVLIAAVGKPGFIKGKWIKKGAVVIDVGINYLGDKIVGDVEFEAAEKRASWITPVPGGVGPLTVTMLMRNLVTAAKLQGLS